MEAEGIFSSQSEFCFLIYKHNKEWALEECLRAKSFSFWDTKCQLITNIEDENPQIASPSLVKEPVGLLVIQYVRDHPHVPPVRHGFVLHMVCSRWFSSDKTDCFHLSKICALVKDVSLAFQHYHLSR